MQEEFLKINKREKNNLAEKSEETLKNEKNSQKASREEALLKKVADIWDQRKKTVAEILEEGRGKDGSLAIDGLVINQEEEKIIQDSLGDEKGKIFQDMIKKNLDSSRGADGQIKKEDLDKAETELEDDSRQLTDKESMKQQLKETILEKRSHNNIKNSKEDLRNNLNSFIKGLNKKRSAVFEKGEMEKAVILIDVYKELLYIRDSLELTPIGLGAESAGKKEQKILEIKGFIQEGLVSLGKIFDSIDKSQTKDDMESGKKKFDEIAKAIQEKIKEIK